MKITPDQNVLPLYSEEDIRTKVVYHWLKNCGLNDSEILVERSIRIKLGRGEKIVNSRTDLLVKRGAENLLIIEVKGADHKLTDEDKHQAISYARCLSGGIAPFTILTAGRESLIFDSVSGENISEVKQNHPYVINGLKATGEALSARAEALEYLITLSDENLLLFCKAQCDYRMQILKSTDINSGKKYIPNLYCERREAQKQLSEQLAQDERSNLTLVVGPPQHGKTCFLCNTVEKRLAQGQPTLFYPGVSLTTGLSHEICEDFEWFFGEYTSPRKLVERINRILTRISTSLTIFVDGWNEMIGNALTMNDECARLCTGKLKIVISTTTTSLKRLLNDSSGNETQVATLTMLSPLQIQRLSTEPLINKGNARIVQIGKFDFTELLDAREKYEQAFNVQFRQTSDLLKDPFYLRLAAEEFANKIVPVMATRASLIRKSLHRKAGRRGISELNLYRGLNELSERLFKFGNAIPIEFLPDELAVDKVYNQWLDSSILLSFKGDSDHPLIDFYYSHERDYCVSEYRKWSSNLSNLEIGALIQEIEAATEGEVGRSALRWFLSCPENYQLIEKIYIDLECEAKQAEVIRELLRAAILNQINFHGNIDFNWLETVISKMMVNPDYEVNHELVELVYARVKSVERTSPEYLKWLRLLMAIDYEEEYNHFDESFIGGVYYESNPSWPETEDETSLEILFFLNECLSTDLVIAAHAIVALSSISPNYFLKNVPRLCKMLSKDNSSKKHIELLVEACDKILDDKQEAYWGSMCPGWLSSVGKGDPEILTEFKKQSALWNPIFLLTKLPPMLRLQAKNLLDDLRDYISDEDLAYIDGDGENPDGYHSADPDQLDLELE